MPVMHKFILCLAGLLAPAGRGQAPQAPPPAPTPVFQWVSTPGRPAHPAGAGPVAWDIGQPADDEQMLLELINRARADPSGEAVRLQQATDAEVVQAYGFFHVDFGRFKADMAQFPPLPPLAPSVLLTTAARGHSQWMLDHADQSHEEGSVEPSARVTAVGYPWNIVGESIYAYAQGPFHAHAGFEVDWGLLDALGNPVSPGMQNPPGHRLNNHNPLFREAGVGLVGGTHTALVNGAPNTVGPKLFTIDFADRPSPGPFVTGVAYFDLNSNGAYDVGEGLGGIRVELSDAAYFAQTPASGGYAIPSANGTHTVTFSAPGLVPVSRQVTVSGGANLKVDLALPYPAPTLTGNKSPGVGRASQYQPSVVTAATAFNWEISRRKAFGATLGAEPGQTGVVLKTSPGYAVVQTDRHFSGANSYRLTHPVGDDQILSLTAHLNGGTSPVLHFAVAFGYTTAAQVLTAEATTDDGATWNEVWSQAGKAGSPDAVFTPQNVPLTGLGQHEFQLRFRFRVQPGGSYYNTLGSGEGVYLDGITFDDVYELTDVGVGQIAATGTVPFTAGETGDFILGVQPLVGARILPWGPKLLVTAVVAVDPPVVRLGTPVPGAGGKLRLDFQVVSGTAAGWVLERTPSPGAPWQTDPTAVLGTNPSGTPTFRVVPTGDGAYYRIRVQ